MYAKNPAGKAVVGTLMSVEEDPNSRYRFEIWFDYTREIMNTIGEGAMVAVPNFYLDGDRRKREWSSVLEISTLLPVHYAIAQGQQGGFPGFLVEAARSAAQDWVDQETESTDDTTKVRCVAIPTNLMIDEGGEIREEQGLPMAGHPAYLLDTEMTEQLANLGLDRERDDVVMIGPLIRDRDVDVYIRVEEALRTHFAIFGFTGAGKSNLLSTLISTLMTRGERGTSTKIVVFDLMGEFSVLLMDLLVTMPNARLLGVGPESFPNSVLNVYAASDRAERERLIPIAANELMRTSLYSKGTKPRREEFTNAYSDLLREHKIRIWQHRELTIGQFVHEHRDEILKGNMGNSAQAVRNLIDQLESAQAPTPFSQTAADSAIAQIRAANQNLNQTAATNLTNLENLLRAEASANRPQAPQSCRVTIPEIVQRLNDEDTSTLIVIQAADPDQLRVFASFLGNALYEDRRHSGRISPLVSFVFDEADEFIPLHVDSGSSYAHSSAIAMTVARRGRKFGMGIGIATQRVTYLNTSIMAQPHTYFISKLPRKSDRERVCEAFGISEDMFRQTFKFKKGNWLLVSHDATGLDAVPLPIKTANADERIFAWLDQRRATQ